MRSLISAKKPLFMAIVNITPDSFSDGGSFLDPKKALDRISKLRCEGADIIDIGAQSSASKKAQISADEEWRRLEPVLTRMASAKLLKPLQNPFSRAFGDALRSPAGSGASKRPPERRVACPSRKVFLQELSFISIDTYRADVAEKALKLGVQMINDVTALRGDPKMIDVLCRYRPYVCLMHSAYDTPYAGNDEKHFSDIMAVIKKFLIRQTRLLLDRDFPKEKIIIDPGLGRFLSNDPKVSFEVIDRLAELKELGFPILLGPSRKSFLGGAMKDRDRKTAEVCRKAVKNGASILRVHRMSPER